MSPFFHPFRHSLLTCRSVAAPRVPKGARGRGRRGGRAGPSAAGRRPKKTVEELDEEMTDYFHDTTGAAPAAV
jgi:THO complex subunit 4